MADTSVQLNISTTAQGQGWTPTQASDGTTYYYKYVGGNSKKPDGSNANNGNAEFEVGTGSKTIAVSFVGGDGNSYSFDSYTNKSAPTDLSGVVNNDNTITITDVMQNVGTFNWGASVAVKNSNPKVTFECDPGVTNRGRNS